MIRAASLSIERDLRGFSLFLQQYGIDHRINEESGQQVIWVAGEAESNLVQQALDNWSSQQQSAMETILAGNTRSGGGGGQLAQKILQQFRLSPLTLILIMACFVVAIISGLGSQSYRVANLFYPLLAPDDFLALLAGINSLEIFARTLSPMLLHFGELHLIFNMLWLWYFGKQLESIHPLWLFAGLIVITSFASNTTQFMMANFNNFGGMSGVVYGLMGYTWVIHQFMPRSKLLIDNRMFVAFLIMLVAMEIFASSWIASAAHVGGLVSGLLLGILVVLYYRLLRRQDSIG